jgi:hypothetical protein
MVRVQKRIEMHSDFQRFNGLWNELKLVFRLCVSWTLHKRVPASFGQAEWSASVHDWSGVKEWMERPQPSSQETPQFQAERGSHHLLSGRRTGY